MTDKPPGCFFPSITTTEAIFSASIEGSSRCTVTPIAWLSLWALAVFGDAS
jgi:hypothetical protein